MSREILVVIALATLGWFGSFLATAMVVDRLVTNASVTQGRRVHTYYCTATSSSTKGQ
jgi:hypothetical protein